MQPRQPSHADQDADQDDDRPGAARPAPRTGTPRDEGVDPELLGYLFDDSPPAPPAPEPARRRVGTALVESRRAGMADAGVRALLARKLCRLLPDLPPDRRDKATAAALRTLERLARDHATHVRTALAGALKDIACAPPAVARTLARDVERSVAEPILHCCATLTDEDLLEVIAAHPAGWALAAIARRPAVSAPLSCAIVDTGDVEATGVLLDNDGAVIPDDRLEDLVERSGGHPDWQAKLAGRSALPQRLALRLAEFVDDSVADLLRRRTDLDAATAAEVAAVTRRRVAWAEGRDPAESPGRRAVRLHRQGALDETALGDALSWEEMDFVRAALALRAAVHPGIVDDILRSSDPRAVTALVWRAGYSMRCAMRVQIRAAGIPPRAVLNARQGTDYPMPAADMARHLALYGIRS
ncbi:DUF2336 domain-containing protein [Azospirillum brasilense]|uniref:DUF2336 domain-containing protein n=1 Tax=Azospirillum brasilense TaxID=192 RepID=UPI00190B4C32|nr:DUF2336 domain-containing protein [Azospirillum brasilense]MBK3734400.1 DUF2336 domain-containing protein [Azospirillum brasilense]